MNTEIISLDHEHALQRAIETLARGGIIAFPTDTVYGLAARVTDASAIERLFLAKGRDFNKSIAVLIGQIDQLALVARQVPGWAQGLMARHWPGALTLVVEKMPGLPAVLSQVNTVGVRMPNHPFALELLRATGPLATTSANISGQDNPITARDVLGQLEGRIDLVIDGGACPGGVPSTVVDCTGDRPVILRAGAIPQANLFGEAG